MKIFALLLCLSTCLHAVAFGQYSDNPKIITFKAKDANCCKILFADGKRFIQITNRDTIVGIGEPVNEGHGEFSVFVAVTQGESGTAEVIPTDFSAWYTDPPHTRFPYVDRDDEVDGHARKSMWLGILAAGLSGAAAATPQQASVHNSDGTNSTVTYTDPNAQARVNQQSAATNEAIRQNAADAKSGLFHRNTVTPGTTVSGIVFFKKPKKSKVKVGKKDRLFAVDIPINGVVYRFE